MKPCPLITVGNIQGVSVFVAPLRPTEILKGAKHEAILHHAHLHIVREDGGLFTEHEFDTMNIVDRSAYLLQRLCKKGVQSLAGAFLPKGTIEPVVHPAYFYIDRNGFAHVSFLVSGYVITR